MFDGSHRSRRTIDLSRGGRRQRQRRTTSNTTTLRTSAVTGLDGKNKAQVLEEARIQREQRRQQHQRDGAAKAIQKIYRAWHTRRHVAQTLEQTTMDAPSPALVLSMRLSKPLKPFLSTTVNQALMEFSSLQEKNSLIVADSSSTSTVFSRLRILRAALLELRPPNDGLLPLVVNLLESTTPTGGIAGYCDLIECCQQWLWNSSNNSMDTAKVLWQWCCRIAASDSTSTATRSLLAATVFCAKSGLFLDQQQQQQECTWKRDILLGPAEVVFHISADSLHEWYHNVLLPALMTVLTQTEFSSPESQLVHSQVSRAVEGRECILLGNALDLYKVVHAQHNTTTASPFAALCTFVQLVLERRQDLAVLVSLVVRGDNLKDLVLNKSIAVEDRMDVAVEDEVSTDDEDEEMEQADNVASKKRHRLSRLTRKDLQTVPKLDRLYQENVQKLRKQVLTQVESTPDKEQLVELAVQLGNPTVWLEWGNAVFANGSEEARKSLVMLLFTLLQSTTGLRTRPQSTFLSQLSFHQGLQLLGGLWHSVLEWSSMSMDTEEHSLLVTAAMTVFCDLFAHHLLVLHDEEFLRYYTGKSAKISAQQVISQLGTMLYEVYWSKPVVAADVSIEQPVLEEERLKHVRARLLLSGTKLWNSLHERWCRLVRHSSFCDESAWWFPRLMSRDADGVMNVLGMDNDDNDSAAMDVDDESDDDDGPPPASAAEQESDALAEAFSDPKMARILTCIPQALPFERRVKLFSSLLAADKLKFQNDESEFHRVMMMMAARGQDIDDNTDFGGRERVEIRRDVLYGDSMDQLNKLGRKLKKKVQVTFVNQHGATEAGIDGGGVFKEFLDDLISEAFDPSISSHQTGAPQLFLVTPMQTLSVNAAASYDLSHYEFLGRVLGKAVYESILVEPQFCLPFLNQLLGKQNTLDDLKNFDDEYYNNLIKLRNLSAKEIDGLGLTFELTTSSGPGNKTRTRELMPGGSSIAVTKQNVIQYVHLVAHQRLNVDGAPQTRAFLKGFRDLIPASWVRLFSSNELQKLISGDDTVRGIDVNGMMATMRYSAGYHPSQPIIKWFWEVVEEMTPEQQRKFLKFMTSCSRQPLLGFQALEPLPCIQQLNLPDALFLENDLEALSKVTPLPTSATCMNLLKLPNYRNKELLKKKLLDAVESGAGFELT